MRIIHSLGVQPAKCSDTALSVFQEVEPDRLREWVQTIAIPRHAEGQREANRATAQWIADAFSEWGYTVKSQGCFANVVASSGNDAKQKILIGAHYDSTPHTPGADDNGSAVAAMLECARIISKSKPDLPLCFVAFNREEDGMLGSEDFVEGLPFRISEAHILEMVGYASSIPGSQKLPTGLPIQIPNVGDFLGLLANQLSGKMMDTILSQARACVPMMKVVGLEVDAGAERAFPVLSRSDHVPFWNRNIPAVMWTDTAEFRNPNYHRETDLPNTLDYDFLRNVTQLLIACAARSEQ